MCSGGKRFELFCFAASFTFTFIFAFTFSSRGVRGAGLRGCVFTFPFAFAFALAFALSFALWRGPNWVGEVGVIIKERGARRARGGAAT